MTIGNDNERRGGKTDGGLGTPYAVTTTIARFDDRDAVTEADIAGAEKFIVEGYKQTLRARVAALTTEGMEMAEARDLVPKKDAKPGWLDEFLKTADPELLQVLVATRDLVQLCNVRIELLEGKKKVPKKGAGEKADAEKADAATSTGKPGVVGRRTAQDKYVEYMTSSARGGRGGRNDQEELDKLASAFGVETGRDSAKVRQLGEELVRGGRGVVVDD